MATTAPTSNHTAACSSKKNGFGRDTAKLSQPHAMSLHLIEEAMLVYQNAKALAPSDAPASLLDACALLDCDLMRLPLQQAGIWPENR